MTTEIGEYIIQYEGPLGQGAFGRVYRGVRKKDGFPVAAKHVLFRKAKIVTHARQEVEVLKLGKDHQNILQIFDHRVEKKELWIIMEYCDLGNLADFAEEYPLELYVKLDILYQTTNALVFLLNLKPKVIHRDIKPANILLKSGDNGEQGVTVKLCDFGVARPVDATLDTKCGTCHYMAPELFEKNPKYDCSIDVFAMGVLILHLIRAKHGQNLESQDVLGDPIGLMMYRIKESKELWCPVVFSMDDSDIILKIKRLIASMVVLNPKKRIPMENVHKEINKLKLLVDPEAPPTDKKSGEDSKPVSYSSSDGMEEYFEQALSLPNVPGLPLSISHPHDPDRPKTAKRLPVLTKQNAVMLKFVANSYVGFARQAVLLGGKEKRTLVRCNVANKFSEAWIKDLPLDVRYNSDKYVTPLHIVCRHRACEPTLVFSHDLQLQRTHNGDYGRLHGTLPGERLLYAKEVMDELYSLDVYQLPGHQHVATLTRPGEPFASDDVSVSCHEKGWLAVVSRSPHTLNIYDASYQHVRHVDLTFKPRHITAVAAVQDWIIVANRYNDYIHVFNWEGEELGTVTNQQLGLGGEYRYIYGIGQAGTVGLQVAAGKEYIVKTLHLFEAQ